MGNYTFIVSNLRKYEVKLFSGLCFPKQKKVRWGRKNPLLNKAEFYPQKCQGLYVEKTTHFFHHLLIVYTLMPEMIPVPLWP